MQRNNRELWLALVAMALITAIYLLVTNYLGAIPAASDFFGHALGILGFVLMLMTEVLYSLRKRSRNMRWGKVAEWLRFHIFTGLVGPYLVLLHTSWKFNGLAGIVTLLTLIIVLSGIVGRYIYTLVPRSVDGIELEAAELEQHILEVERARRQWEQTYPQILRALPASLKDSTPSTSLWGRAIAEWRYQRRWQHARRQLDAQARQQARQLELLIQRQRTLQRQVRTLAVARHTLSLWHAVHIPIGVALFTTAFIHIGAAIYYATLLR